MLNFRYTFKITSSYIMGYDFSFTLVSLTALVPLKLNRSKNKNTINETVLITTKNCNIVALNENFL